MVMVQRLFMVLVLLLLTAPISCSTAAPVPAENGPAVQWICTTEEKPWVAMPDIPITSDAKFVSSVKIYAKRPMQTIDGFGGCFNELGWNALKKLPAAERDAAIKGLFDESGCAFTMARSPIGSSDFGASWYSLDDILPADKLPNSTDYALTKFSIDRDKGCLIQYIKAAMVYQKGLKVWGSAWSPPTWMKDSNTYHGGSIRWNKDNLTAYAKYLAMYAEAYQKEGVNLYAVHVQNEPNIGNGSDYPTCLWNAEMIRDFVRDYMGPTFKERKTNAEIWLGTLCDGNFNDVTDTVLSDKKANAFITGVALQYVGQYQIDDVAKMYPDKKIIQSETPCHAGKNDWDDAEETHELINFYLDHGASAYFMWNMVLDESGKSTWDWKQNAMITANTKTGKAIFNSEFYVMKHFSHFIKPGAKRLFTTGPWGDCTAFLNPDGTTILEMGNVGDTTVEKIFAVSFADDPRTFSFTVPPRSVSTFIIPAQAK